MYNNALVQINVSIYRRHFAVLNICPGTFLSLLVVQSLTNKLHCDIMDICFTFLSFSQHTHQLH